MNEFVSAKCRGCSACKAICPVGAIEMILSDEGFWTAVKSESCISCGECEQFCKGIVNSGESIVNRPVVSAVSKDKSILERSSSGGVGFLISEQAYDSGVQVVGCVYDPKSQAPLHIIAKSRIDLERMQGSKYLQSNFQAVVDALEVGELKKGVIFGTPCQIAGIHNLLKRKSMREEFLLVEFFCHGVPSLLAWKRHTADIFKKQGIDGTNSLFSFRENKEFVLKCFEHELSSRVVYRKAWREDAFYHMFLDGSIMAEACYTCPFRRKSCADIRMGDFATHENRRLEYAPSSIIPLTKNGEWIVSLLQDKMEMKKSNYSEIDAVQESESKPLNPSRRRRLDRLMSGEAPAKIMRFKVIASRAKGAVIKMVSLL